MNMARQTCLSSKHLLCFFTACVAAFLIQSNESLIQAWGTRCITRQVSSGVVSRNEKKLNYFGTFVALRNSNGDSDAAPPASDPPIEFFANEKDTESSESGKESWKTQVKEERQLLEVSKLEEEVPLTEEQRDAQLREWREKAVQTVEKIIKPLSEIQDGVPAERIKGAAIAATALTFFASKGVIASGAVGLGAAYVSISKSIAGDFLRTVGEITWDATESASKLADQLGVVPTFGEVDKTVVNKYKRRKPIIGETDVDEGELASIEADDDDDLARVLREAESVIDEADAAIAKAEAEAEAEADQTEKVKQSIEEELKMIAEKAETEERQMIANEAEEKFDEEMNLTTEEEEDEASELLENESILFDDDQYIAAIELAQEEMEGKIVGVDDIIADNSAKAEWKAAGKIANELIQDSDTGSEAGVDEEDVDFDLGDMDLETLGRAAREAVEAFESDVVKADEAISDQRREWADSMIEEDDGEADFDFDDDEDVFSSDSLNEIAEAARAAVEANSNSATRMDSPNPDNISGKFVSKDWSSLKVVELREELKKRGLKTSGRKADLVSLLEKSDLEISDQNDKIEANTILEDDGDDEIGQLESFDIEELGRQAREAVEMFQTSGGDFDEEPTEEMLAELESEMEINGEFLGGQRPSIDVSKMTVAQLKEECRNRGLKVGGRKAELIERLENLTN